METTRREFIGAAAAAVVGAPLLSHAYETIGYVDAGGILKPGYEQDVTYTEFGMSWEWVERPPFTRSHQKRLDRQTRAIVKRKKR